MKCADMADAFDDGYKRGFNTAIDKAVEVVSSFKDEVPQGADGMFVDAIAEELKKLKKEE